MYLLILYFPEILINLHDMLYLSYPWFRCSAVFVITYIPAVFLSMSYTAGCYNQGEDLGNIDDQPNVKAASKDDLYKKPERPLTLNSDWNTIKTISFRPPQTWISKITKAGKPHLTFDELMSTPIDFSTYAITHWGPKQQRFYGYPSNRKSKHDVFSIKRIIIVTHVKVMKWYDYGYLEEIEVRREDHQLYKFREGDFPRINMHDIEDVILFLVQKKLSNLERDVIYDLNVALRMFTRRIVILKRVEGLQMESKATKRSLISPGLRLLGEKREKGIVSTEIELVLEQTQQGTSHEVLVSTKGVEE
nr:hypothetical protein [Tanacetum cinerariifolium]